jgi:hypothetical protein
MSKIRKEDLLKAINANEELLNRNKEELILLNGRVQSLEARLSSIEPQETEQ